MWMFTKHGFFSAVCKASDPDTVKVRARNLPDLEKLWEHLSENDIVPSEIVKTPGRDYCCRFFLPKAQWARAMMLLGDELDYTNFKSAVHGEADRDRAYMDVWSIMYRYQSTVAD